MSLIVSRLGLLIGSVMLAGATPAAPPDRYPALTRLLVAMRPDAAAAVNGREYGHNRVIRGAHSVRAVEAGRQAAAAIVAVSHGSPRFRTDLDAARQEFAAAR